MADPNIIVQDLQQSVVLWCVSPKPSSLPLTFTLKSCQAYKCLSHSFFSLRANCWLTCWWICKGSTDGALSVLPPDQLAARPAAVPGWLHGQEPTQDEKLALRKQMMPHMSWWLLTPSVPVAKIKIKVGFSPCASFGTAPFSLWSWNTQSILVMCCVWVSREGLWTHQPSAVSCVLLGMCCWWCVCPCSQAEWERGCKPQQGAE